MLQLDSVMRHFYIIIDRGRSKYAWRKQYDPGTEAPEYRPLLIRRNYVGAELTGSPTEHSVFCQPDLFGGANVVHEDLYNSDYSQDPVLIWCVQGRTCWFRFSPSAPNKISAHVTYTVESFQERMRRCWKPEDA